MTAATASARLRRPTTQAARWARRSVGRVRGLPDLQVLVLVALGLALLWAMTRWPEHVSWALYGPLVVLAGLVLRPRRYLAVCALYAAFLAFHGSAVRGWSVIQGATMVALLATAALMFVRSASRARLGVQGNAGDDMLVDLRDRLRELGDIPRLPAGWHAETAINSAYGDKFSGDFAVTSLSPEGDRLEIVLVDLSGKGATVATRSLLLSGAIGGLLGQVGTERLLESANSYLLRQHWDEGFATAVHVSIDLRSGAFCIGNAGHPGPFQFHAGSGRWAVHTSVGGPLLGIVDGATYPRRCGTLGRGDALVLYTDGVIEARGRDLAMGADRLMGAAEQLVRDGFAGGARRLVTTATAGESDDRAIVLVWRD